MISLSGLGVMHSLLWEASGNSSQLLASSGLSPESHLSCKFSDHPRPEEVAGFRLGRTCSTSAMAFSTQNSAVHWILCSQPLCLRKLDTQSVAMRMCGCQSTGTHFPPPVPLR